MISIEGLSESEVQRRRAQGQANTVQRKTGRTAAEIIKTNLFTRVNALLGVLFLIVCATGSLINGAFGLLIICNSAVGIIQELRAKRTLDKLTILSEAPVTVIREGKKKIIAQEEIVLGDIIEISAGEQLVVDGTIIDSQYLDIDESLLTGESDPIEKEKGDKALSGSYVVAGSGYMEAIAVGADSYSAQLIAEAGRFTLTGSQIQAGINTILRVITWIIIPVGLLTIYTQLVRSGENLKDAILAMVAALVPMVPEGLVLMTSVAFAVGVVRLGRRKTLVNELPAIEALARVDTVCADKTGTLTENKMVFSQLIPLEETEEQAYTILSSIAHADEHPNDTMEAIIQATKTQKYWEIKNQLPFDSRRKWSAWDYGDKGCYVFGAPDIVLPPGYEEKIHIYSDQGLRVLAIVRVPSHIFDSKKIEPSENITPVALVLLDQKLRDDVPSTLDFFTHEGVNIKVISGDNAASVGAVARAVGIDGKVLDARELPSAEKEPDAFREKVLETQVFGRVTPAQKRDIVHTLQKSGSNVAMTGDGVNDVLALKDANIGVAMGAGSSATRSVAQVVLLDNHFSVLPHVVAEGRRVIGNIERVANLFLVKTVYSALLALITGIMGVAFPFLPIHVTMAGWFAIGIPAFILSLAPNYERARDGFTRRVLILAVPAGVVIAILTAVFWLMHYPGSADARVATPTLVVLLMSALWVLCVVARPLNWWRVLLVLCSYGFYAVIFLVKPLSDLFFLDSSDSSLMLRAVCFGVVGMVCIEIIHRITCYLK